MFKYFTFLGLIIVASIACGGAPPKQAVAPVKAPEKPKIPLPNTPETVVVAWEGWIAKNQYEYAGYVSVDKELDYVTTLAKSQEIEPLAPSQSQTLDVHCSTQGDVAVCTCTVRDAKYGDERWKYFLIKKSGQWMLSDVVPNDPAAVGESEKKTARPIQ